jgi:hypothetical protein
MNLKRQCWKFFLNLQRLKFRPIVFAKTPAELAPEVNGLPRGARGD